ncbi:MAG: mannose-1-phosphate guanylyltransferase/mannose-6-phosphate isomerase [Sulfuritalea sp.]|jgi:mannose-1-phosphate guanylyltransferase/mannose-6-phosphate isomerase|nr:mannose-1-phosphate guanylyltransferase/mannose-6-phosphate isomerase [Sulfuritalea sp.]
MSDSLLVPVVLSGGSGTRLWPVSREKHPKQLQPLLGGESLLQNTVRRLEGLPLGTPIIVSNQEYRFITAEQLRQLGLAAWTLLLEPVGRNTAPALTAAALYAMRDGADPVLLATPADHHVRNAGAFREAVLRGFPEAESGAVVTFGIVPDRPETGYGYIETKVGACRPAKRNSRQTESDTARGAPVGLLAFCEKPDAATAAAYVAGGRHFWNSGIFMLRASVWLKAIDHFAPEILAACRKAVDAAHDDGDFVRLDADAFAASPADSIDYAVMEKLPAVTTLGIPSRVVPLDVGWSDVGAWDALWQAIDRDADNNAVKGDVWLEDSHGNLVIAEHGLVACIGCEDMVVVETADAVLIAPKSRTQEVKRIVSRLKAAGRSEVELHRKVHRPWGWYDGIDSGERFQVKRIVVRPGATLSLQMHHHRAEHWVVVRGTAKVTRGNEIILLGENESTYIPLGVKHRLENPGQIPLEIIEVQSGSYLGEDDIVRFEDNYGRKQ